MRVEFPYGDAFSPVYVPESNLLGVFEPAEYSPVSDIQACVIQAVDNPIGSPRLDELAKGCESALIISDDYTRQTPVDVIIPILERILHDAGVNNIRILVALGTHRPMTEEETLTRFGQAIIDRIPIIQHEYKNLERLTDLGTTENGFHLTVNSAVMEADLVIGLGQIVPHRIAGFSGGAKIILPGICGASAIAQTHWMGSLEQGEKMLGFEENPIRAEMDYAASQCKLKFIVNAVCDPQGSLVGVFAGDYIKAHREGCKLSREVFGVKLPDKADIVIADSFPKDIELWQAAKALYAADLMVKDGGVVIIITPCPEGVAKSHPQILERGYTTEEETLCDVDSGKLSSLSAAAHCLRVGRLIKEKATGIMVKNGIPRSDIEHLGFLYAETPSKALEMAFQITEKEAKVAILRRGGEALPVIENRI